MQNDKTIIDIVTKYEQRLSKLSVQLTGPNESPSLSQKAVKNLFAKMKQELCDYENSISEKEAHFIPEDSVRREGPMNFLFENLKMQFKSLAQRCPSGTGRRDKIWLEDAEALLDQTKTSLKDYVQLPCKPGDKLYDISDFLDDRESPEITELRCNYIAIIGFKNGEPVWEVDSTDFTMSDIGTRIFYSEEAANNAIEEYLSFQAQNRCIS